MTKTCENPRCARAFTAATRRARYCSDNCRKRASERRCAPACPGCGAQVSDPRHAWCSDCYEVPQIWPRELILARIREWADLHGEPPAMTDWNPTRARDGFHDEARARRFEDAGGHWPWFSIVVRRFGSWNAAIAAAGFTGRAPHGGAGNSCRRRVAA